MNSVRLQLSGTLTLVSMLLVIIISTLHPHLLCVCLSGKTEYQATHGGRLRRASTFERRPSRRYPSRTQSLGKSEFYLLIQKTTEYQHLICVLCGCERCYEGSALF